MIALVNIACVLAAALCGGVLYRCRGGFIGTGSTTVARVLWWAFPTAAEAKSLIDGHEKLCAERFGRIDRTLGRVLGWAVAGAGTTIGMLIAAVATLLWYNITHR